MSHSLGPCKRIKLSASVSSATPIARSKGQREDEKPAFKKRSKIFDEFKQNGWQPFQSPEQELRGPDDLSDSQTLICLEILAEWFKSISSRGLFRQRLFESFLVEVFNGWTSKAKPSEVQIVDKWPMGGEIGWGEGLAPKSQAVGIRKIWNTTDLVLQKLDIVENQPVFEMSWHFESRDHSKLNASDLHGVEWFPSAQILKAEHEIIHEVLGCLVKSFKKFNSRQAILLARNALYKNRPFRRDCPDAEFARFGAFVNTIPILRGGLLTWNAWEPLELCTFKYTL